MLEPKWLDSNMKLKLFCRYSYLHTGPKSVHLLEVSQSTRKKDSIKVFLKKVKVAIPIRSGDLFPLKIISMNLVRIKQNKKKKF